MLDQNQRWIHFYGIHLAQVPPDAPTYQILEVFQILDQVYRDKKFFTVIDKGTASIRIRDLSIEKVKGQIHILFQYSDKKISDPAFSKFATGDVRSALKEEDEGVAVSAHAVIYTKPIKDGGLEFEMRLEDSPGIGKTKITRIMNQFLKHYLTRDYVDPSDNAIKKCHPTFVMDHYSKQSLRQDLEEGELKYIELVKNETIHDLDEQPCLKRVEQVIKITAEKKSTGDEAINFANAVKRYARTKDYHDIRVVFNNNEGKQRSVKVPTFREDAGEILFGKLEMVEVDYSLPQCAMNLDPTFIIKMNSLK
ncbi:hypothetical protein [Pseudomonas sp. RIT411]|uniref:hypothetical protein n=1 Tax=Pseudomonas sp. RIT411 TaxID=2202160 RepID=UPI000D38051D|nr:hypothetical protein [Pseudomonas sp. RIT 411]RAU39283.1 hypothetical protein DBY63_012455 [Pseudomonas sp. RIT 411]